VRFVVVASDLHSAFEIPVAGTWRTTHDRIVVRSPYSGSVVTEVTKASRDDVEEAIAAAHVSFSRTRTIPAHERSRILAEVSRRITAERQSLARTLTLETGKPIRDGQIEVDRAAMTFGVAAEEAKRIGAEVVPMDWSTAGENRVAINRRFPIGLVVGISPFNYPLNLVAHKVAPAIAAGNPIVVKPASQTPTSAIQIARFAHDAGWPTEALSVLPVDSAVFEPFVADPRVKKVTFTGSTEVGWRLKQLAWRTKVTLEMGGNAGVIVHEDADLEYAVNRVAAGGFGFAGQSCISVQRVYVHRSVWDRFIELLLARAQALRIGDPLDEATDIGPMISSDAVDRYEEWLDEAIAGGARALVRGERMGGVVGPTVLVDAAPAMRVCAREVFAPLINLFPYDRFEDAVASVDDSVYGLQAGVFTRDVARIWYAFENLEVGGLMVNEIPSWRIDHMPYGGVKESGCGREGLRYAIEEMTEPRLMVLQLR
jgi:acyl-CoA reductase-like NAD-dependent aldehyde dehydrogenase